MSTYLKDMGTLTIVDGATLSNILTGFEDCDAAYIFSNSQSTAFTGTVTVRVSGVAGAATTTTNAWADLTSGGSDVTIAAGNSVPITDTAFYSLMVASSGSEVADISFRVVGRFRVAR